MTNEKLTAKAFLKIVVLTILGCIGVLILYGIIFILSLPLMNATLSLILCISITSAVVALVMIYDTLRRRKGMAQK